MRGKFYFVAMDRYSSWPIVAHVKTITAQNMNFFCETFGICENLPTDGGQQFVAGEFEDFE